MHFGGILMIKIDQKSIKKDAGFSIDFLMDFGRGFGTILVGSLDEKSMKNHLNPMVFFDRFLLDF